MTVGRRGGREGVTSCRPFLPLDSHGYIDYIVYRDRGGLGKAFMPAPASALTEQAPSLDLPTLILEVPEPVWKKISTALQVKTRQEAVQMVQADPNAAAAVMQIIKGQTALTEGAPAAQPTALTSGINIPSAAERIYGAGKAKLQY